jgi:hypothetical protein
MILEILFVVTMFLWFLSALPWPPLNQFAAASWILAFVSVLILGIFVFTGGGTHLLRTP